MFVQFGHQFGVSFAAFRGRFRYPSPWAALRSARRRQRTVRSSYPKTDAPWPSVSPVGSTFENPLPGLGGERCKNSYEKTQSQCTPGGVPKPPPGIQCVSLGACRGLDPGGVRPLQRRLCIIQSSAPVVLVVASKKCATARILRGSGVAFPGVSAFRSALAKV